MARKTWEYISNTATSDKGLSAKDRVSFHYFNPNGLYAQKKALDAEIDAMVDAGLVKSGWILAYGGFDDYEYKRMKRLADLKRPSARVVHLWTESFAERNRAVRIRIDEAKGLCKTVTAEEVRVGDSVRDNGNIFTVCRINKGYGDCYIHLSGGHCLRLATYHKVGLVTRPPAAPTDPAVGMLIREGQPVYYVINDGVYQETDIDGRAK